MFLGESDHTLDAKNRVFVPKRFQEHLDRDEKGSLRAVLTRGFDGCLFLFSATGFRAVVERLQTQSFEGQQLRTVQRKFFANTHEVSLDSSGRILIPEKLKGLAKLEREVVMLGAAERAVIWDATKWREIDDETDDDFEGMDTVLCGGGGAHPSSGGPSGA